VQAYRRFGYQRAIDPRDTIWIAEHGGEILGIVRIAEEEGVLVLRGMRIAEQVQRRRIGSRLLEEIAAWLGSRECFCVPYAHLVNFYAQAGFAQIEPESGPAFLTERVRDYRASGLDAILMKR